MPGPVLKPSPASPPLVVLLNMLYSCAYNYGGGRLSRTRTWTCPSILGLAQSGQSAVNDNIRNGHFWSYATCRDCRPINGCALLARKLFISKPRRHKDFNNLNHCFNSPLKFWGTLSRLDYWEGVRDPVAPSDATPIIKNTMKRIVACSSMI